MEMAGSAMLNAKSCAGKSSNNDAAMEADARTLMCEQLKAVGFAEVAMLSKPCQPSDAVEVGPRVVAA